MRDIFLSIFRPFGNLALHAFAVAMIVIYLIMLIGMLYVVTNLAHAREPNPTKNLFIIAGVPDRIVDGDTLVIAGNRIRLWGIDAPEMHQDGGPESRSALIKIINGRDVFCRVRGTDRYRRFVGQCMLKNGKDIARLLVCAGHARAWPKYSGSFYLHGCGV